jgi:ABC-type thiamin/hydroxymethylpyrimidine transport system permease subunit
METPAAYHPVMQYGTAMLCSLIAATVLSIAIQVSGEQTVKRGIVCAAVLWLGFVATSWAKEYIFEVRTLQIYGINAGYALLDMMPMGAIVGGWRGKARSV